MTSFAKSAVALASVAALFACAWGAAAHPVRAAASSCAPRHSRTLVQNDQVRVYAQRDAHGRGRKYLTAACDKRSGRTYLFDVPEGGYYAFGPPAIGLRGHVVGFANESTCDGFGSCTTLVRAVDVSRAGTSRETLNFGHAGPSRHTLVKIGSLRVTHRGTLIWISCPEHDRRHVLGTRTPNCTRPGDDDRVYALRRGQSKLRLLDRGRAVDPGSLRVSHGRASWSHAGATRDATVE